MVFPKMSPLPQHTPPSYRLVSVSFLAILEGLDHSLKHRPRAAEDYLEILGERGRVPRERSMLLDAVPLRVRSDMAFQGLIPLLRIWRWREQGGR